MPGCNEANCLCPEKDCSLHGKCCECVNYHRGKGNFPVCLRSLLQESTQSMAERKANSDPNGQA